MNIISIFSFSVAFLIACSLLKKGADVVSPGRIFAFTWCIVIGLANLKLSRFQSEWYLMDWLFLTLGPCSFLIGLYITHILNINSDLYSVEEIRTILNHKKVEDKKLFNLILIAFITYITGYIAIYLTKGYLPLFTHRPAAARIEYSIFGIGLMIHNMPVILFFSIFYHIAVNNNRYQKLILKFIIFVTLLTYLFLLQRYQLIMVSVMVFVFLYYSTRHIKFRTILIFMLLATLIIYIIATLRAGKIVQNVLYVTSAMKFSYKYAIFTEPYMYLVMNLENFVRAVNHLDHHTYGYFTFDFALALTGLKHWISDYFQIVENPYLISGYNTYTFFWNYYRDFGLLGISVIQLIFGLFVGSLYYSIRRYPSLEAVSFYGIVAFLMAFSFFLSPVGFLWFIYIIIWFLVIFRIIRFRENLQFQS